MKFILLLSAVVLVASESQRPEYNPRYSQVTFQRVQAPYPAAGYLPAGQQFRLPARQQQVPQTVYGPPPPPTQGPPAEAATTETLDATTTEAPTTTEVATEPETEQIKEDKSGKLSEQEQSVKQGVYYIYHPSGLLQKVVYSTKDDVENMGYTAQLKYQNVAPIQDPIFTYDPETYAFRQVQV